MRAVLNQRSDQPQQLLLFWAVASLHKKGPDVDVGSFAARSDIGFVSDEYSAGRSVTGETPAVSVGTLINLSNMNIDAECSWCRVSGVNS